MCRWTLALFPFLISQVVWLTFILLSNSANRIPPISQELTDDGAMLVYVSADGMAPPKEVLGEANGALRRTTLSSPARAHQPAPFNTD